MKILVCDDEKWIREGIRTMLVRSNISSGNLEVQCVRDGTSAVEAIKTKKPDIIITDIRMPNFDGLQMIEAVKEQISPSKIIVISGYSDFNYALKSLKLGVSDYLLKPIDENALLTAVKKCLSTGENYNERIFELSRWLDKKGPCPKYISAAFVRVCVCRTLHNLNDRKNIFFKQKNDYLIFQNAASEITCLFFNSEQDSPTPSIDAFMQKYCPMLESGFYVCGIGNAVKSDYAWVSCNQARTSLLYYILYPKHFIYDFTNLKERREKALPDLFSQAGLLVPLTEHNTAQYAQRIGTLFEYMKKKPDEINPKELLDFFQAFIHEVSRVWAIEDTAWQSFCGQIEDCWRQDELKNLLQALPSMLPGKADMRVKRNFIKALEYIDAHYTEVLSMPQVAAAAGLSSTYFSKIFAECAGEPFQKYLIRRRVEKAKQLLRESNAKIYETADQLGYSDYRIFSKNFKDITGMSPQEYLNTLTP
jgi:two-component system response regulator YesN